MVIMPDADLDMAADALMGAAYGSAGERCMAVSVAVPVTDKVADALIDRLAPRVRELKIGPSVDGGSDMGPLVTADALARLDWALPDDADAVIVELGANDGLRGFDLDETRRALDDILTRLKVRDLPVLLTGMEAPRNFGEDYSQRFRAMYAELAEKHDVLFYPFFLEGVAMNPELNQPDGIHPTAEGVDVIVQNILPKVRQLIARASEGSASVN
jgi:lysophospholipase L1-like esterase